MNHVTVAEVVKTLAEIVKTLAEIVKDPCRNSQRPAPKKSGTGFNFCQMSHTRNCLPEHLIFYERSLVAGSPESAPMFSVVFFWIVPMAAVDIISRVLALTPEIASETL